MWSYRIGTGIMSENGKPRPEVCYAGRGEGKNNPAMVTVARKGPLPPGKYRIEPAYNHPHLGPVTMNLTPLPGTDMHGRSLFRIHADSISHPGEASEGCIVAAKSLREAINKSQDRVLEVTE